MEKKDNNTVKETNDKKETKQGTSPLLRVAAMLGVLVIVGLIVLALVASLSNWENSFGIFLGALSASIFIPIVIYLIKFFTGRN